MENVVTTQDQGDPFMNKRVWVRSISIISCSLSIVGSLLIIASFLCFKELRSLGRQILVNISAMDLGVALANLVGAAVYFDGYYHTQKNCTTKYMPVFSSTWRARDNLILGNGSHVICPKSGIIDGLCISQAFFSVYFTYASILWTNSLSIYLYLRIVHNSTTHLARSSLRFSYVFCYLMPLFLSVWLVLSGKLGYSPYESSGWCSIVLRDPADGNKRNIFVSIFGYNLWIILTFVLVPILSLTVHLYVRNEVKKPFTYQSTDRFTLALQNVDYKFLLIPVVFIILRFWSFLGDVLNVFAVNHKIPSWFADSLIILEGIGDSAQGFTNSVIFVVFTKKVRDKFLRTLLCCQRSLRSKQRQIQGAPLNTGERRYLLDKERRRSKADLSSSSLSSEHTPPVTD